MFANYFVTIAMSISKYFTQYTYWKTLLKTVDLYPRGGHGNTLQYSCLENPMDRGAWQTMVHGLAKS